MVASIKFAKEWKRAEYPSISPLGFDKFQSSTKARRMEPINPRHLGKHHDMGVSRLPTQVDVVISCRSFSTCCCYLFLSFDSVLFSPSLRFEQKITLYFEYGFFLVEHYCHLVLFHLFCYIGVTRRCAKVKFHVLTQPFLYDSFIVSGHNNQRECTGFTTTCRRRQIAKRSTRML